MNKIEEIENNTKKILESGFVEAFIEHYVEIKDIDETENTKLIYLMCNDIEEIKVITLNQIDKTKSIIKDLGFSTLSFAFIENMKRNLKLEKSNYWKNRFADEFKDNIIHFQTISYLFENTYNFKDERFTDEIKIALFQENYEHDNYLKEKPLIKDVSILLEKEEELIDDILYLIEDYQKNEWWDIDILSFEHYRKYNTSIDVLFKFSELLFQLKQLSMYNEFLEIEKNEFSNDEKIPSVNSSYNNYIESYYNTIKEQINNIDSNKKWEYLFFNEKDFLNFVTLLAKYFSNYEDFEVPNSNINIRKQTKTRFAKCLREIHYELSENPLSSDDIFFSIIRKLSVFSELKNNQIYSALTK
ncbi:MAG: hypothetical protein RSF68_07280 [Myroides sp.]